MTVSDIKNRIWWIWYKVRDAKKRPKEKHENRILCVRSRLERKFRMWIIIKYTVTVEESTQSRHLRREIHQDDLHLDVKFEL